MERKIIHELQNPKQDATKEQHIVVVGSDTVISFEGNILEKPASNLDAVSMLMRLSGNKHHVLTGVCIVLLKIEEKSVVQQEEALFHDATEVTFKSFNESVAQAYVATAEPMNKVRIHGIPFVF